ncbi:PREDICTED: succinate dehydrogenase cytochrome b560 subunit, mitochondrial-like [Nicrophorus vespilloides]|uniref:Succinate dehydrogenase cytochrome b560 subunit, mitochondrial-like n=1 Tax=Nicrophorus vespilloides TaxID=110193 RepID=A0ABM1MCM5_NICVS|nr:PREDICTED: succinate dehydrogenase cytochrome b560 subunit, mitochondrial-like [Nicrophorus vespilloides]
MSAICRLAGRQLCSRLANSERNSLLFVRPVTIQAQPYKEPPKQGHDEKNMQLGRPCSPHLTVYQVQLTSTLSISHRITGCMLSGYAMAFGFGAMLPGDFTTFLDGLHLNSACIFSIKMMLAFPFSYHFLNGIRHLSWDAGKFLTIKEVYTTGYVMVAAAFALTACLAAL